MRDPTAVLENTHFIFTTITSITVNVSLSRNFLGVIKYLFSFDVRYKTSANNRERNE